MTNSLKATDLPGRPWFKSSYSGGEQGQCIEVKDARHTPYTCIAIRDSKTPDGPALLISPAAFANFVGDVAADRFDI
ncbi:DUF397 domain-containing protein [Streptomyces sp. NPDC001107]